MSHKNIIKGHEQDISQGMYQVAKQLLFENMDISLIMRITNLSEEKIEKLQNNQYFLYEKESR